MQDPTVFTQLKPHFPEQEQLKCPRCDSTNTKFCYYNNYNLSQPRHFCKNCRRYWTKGGALRNIPVGGGSRKNSKRSSNSKKSSSSSSSSSSSTPNTSTQNPNPNPNPKPEVNSILESNSNSTAAVDNSHHRHHHHHHHHHQDESSARMLDISAGSFSSLLASNGQFGNLLDVLNSNGSGVKFVANPSLSLNSEAGLIRNPGPELQSNNGSSEGFLGSLQNSDSSCWEAGINDNGNGNDDGNGNGWPDLSIYTPGSSFHLNR